MKWDLFVDESGDFFEGSPSVVAGFICPSGRYNYDIAKRWCDEIIQDVLRDGIATSEELEKGELLTMINRNRPKAEYEDAISVLRNKYIVFTHCSENPGGAKRWNFQKYVMGKINERLTSVGGVMVVFDNPDNVFNVDNNTTYLTVLVRGLVQLFNQLKDEDGYPEITVYAAERNNITKKKENKIEVSPTKVPDGQGGQQNVLIEVQYANQLKNMALLYGGTQLMTHPAFTKMLTNIQIIKDDDAAMLTGTLSRLNAIKAGTEVQCADFKPDDKYRYISNPLTTICDYIANSYLAIHHKGREAKRILQDCYNSQNTIVIDAFQNMARTDYSMDAMLQSENYAAVWSTLIKTDFPERDTNRFFAELDKKPAYVADAFIGVTDDFFAPLVQSQNDMPFVLEKLQKVIDIATRFSAVVAYPIKASMYLFQNALYTHLGDNASIQRTKKCFDECLKKIPEAMRRNQLKSIYYNRKIVFYTDEFDYETAEYYFKKAEKYWECQLMYTLEEDEEIVPFEGYGKTIGSFLQLSAHMMRASGEEAKKQIYDTAKKYYKDHRNNLIRQGDLVRCYQNLCFVDTEAGYFSDAFRYLYCSIDPLKKEKEENVNCTAEKCEELVAACETNPFLLLNYTHLCCEALRKNQQSEIGVCMLNTLLQKHPFEADYGSFLQDVDPRLLWRIRWRMTYAIAMNGLQKHEHTRVIGAFNSVYNDCMKNGEKLFICFAVAIKSEEIFLAYSGKLSATEKQIDQWKQDLLNAYNNVKNKGGIDPFAGLITPESITEKEKLKKITQKIAY